jgi:hypothetical protein
LVNAEGGVTGSPNPLVNRNKRGVHGIIEPHRNNQSHSVD